MSSLVNGAAGEIKCNYQLADYFHWVSHATNHLKYWKLVADQLLYNSLLLAKTIVFPLLEIRGFPTIRFLFYKKKKLVWSTHSESGNEAIVIYSSKNLISSVVNTHFTAVGKYYWLSKRFFFSFYISTNQIHKNKLVWWYRYLHPLPIRSNHIGTLGPVPPRYFPLGLPLIWIMVAAGGAT